MFYRRKDKSTIISEKLNNSSQDINADKDIEAVKYDESNNIIIVKNIAIEELITNLLNVNTPILPDNHARGFPVAEL